MGTEVFRTMPTRVRTSRVVGRPGAIDCRWLSVRLRESPSFNLPEALLLGDSSS
jgi:hypothetical protein